ncbi:helix-turn-helix domain-containing protein [Nocardia sp. NBC_00508]|uniref:helix-turn-helix domain-containing protein n=1 Tax=Nocardia sp. NBC_00508 TaxID=2975992 RepID=UPI002E8150C8|nr:helix-turn-helix transcriptional regulator [Nocardia sp. NBC_00508]WUD66861.1 helix-turn-helix domain-containing protein [Nocardia sp. NBC_00508]
MPPSKVRQATDSPGSGNRPVAGGGPTVLRMMLGGRLRRLREARGITREAAGEAIRGSHSKISRLELGRTGCRERDLVDLLDLYRVTDAEERERYLELARQANASGWWARDNDWLPKWFDTYLGLEQAARLIRGYEPRSVPELLQTPEYAHAVLGLAHAGESAQAIERRVALRMRRQEILSRPEAPQLWMIIEEAALRRRIGGSTVWRAQLDHLLRAEQQPHITIQILADHVGGPALADGAFTVLRFAETDLPDIVYLQQLTGALYLDKIADLDAYYAVLNQLSVLAAPPEHSRRLLEALRDGVPPTVDEPGGHSET